MISLCLVIWLNWAQALPSLPDDAIFLQKIQPQLEARQTAASQRLLAGQRFFDGEGRFSSAFLGLSGLPLYDVAAVQSRILILQKRVEDRERERLQGPDHDFSKTIQAKWIANQKKALAAEEQSDLLERRFLSALLVLLQRSPEMKALGSKKQNWEKKREGLSMDKPLEQKQIVEMVEQQQRLNALLDAFIDEARGVSSFSLLLEKEKMRLVDDFTSVQSTGQLERLSLLFPMLSKQEQILAKERIAKIEEIQDKKILEMWKKKWTEEQKEGSLKKIDISEQNKNEIQKKITSLKNDNAEKKGIKNEIIEVQLSIYERRLEYITNTVQIAVKREQKIKKELSESRKKLDEALRKSQQENEKKKKRILDKIVFLRELTEDLNSTESKRLEEGRKKKDRQDKHFKEISKKIQTALALPPMDTSRQDSLDKAFGQIHALVREVRADITLHHQLAKKLKKKDYLHQLPTIQKNNSEKLIQEQNQALIDLHDAHAVSREHVLAEIDEFIHVLQRAKVKRREVQPLVSSSAIDTIHSDFWQQLKDELYIVPIKMGTIYRDLKEWLAGFPGNIIGVKQLSLSFWFFIKLALLVAFWKLCRQNSHLFFRRFFSFFQRFLQYQFFLSTKKVEIQAASFPALCARLIDILLLLYLSSYFASSIPFVCFLAYLLAFYWVIQICSPIVEFLVEFFQDLSIPRF